MKNNLIKFFFLSCLLLNFHCSRYSLLTLDENRILKDSRKAFSKEVFQKEPFLKSAYFKGFADYLLKNCEEIINFNQNTDSTWEISKGTYRGFTKRGKCFDFITSSSHFLEYYSPSNTIDSISYYLTKLNPELVPRFKLCTVNESYSLDKTRGNLVLYLGYEHNPVDNPNYYLEHFVYINRSEPPKPLIRTIQEYLQKDTLLVSELKYAIRIIPYAGI